MSNKIYLHFTSTLLANCKEWIGNREGGGGGGSGGRETREEEYFALTPVRSNEA